MDERVDVGALMQGMGRAARDAAHELAFAPSDQKDAALRAAADAIWAGRVALLAANADDMAAAAARGLSAAMLDRLKLDEGRVKAMAEGLRAIADQPDPVGQVIAEWDRPSGLHIRRVRTPLGVVGVIFESRPNVTADAGALCLKAGNAAILRGPADPLHQRAHVDPLVHRPLPQIAKSSRCTSAARPSWPSRAAIRSDRCPMITRASPAS